LPSFAVSPEALAANLSVVGVADDDRPILVATDGHSHADTALVAAAFLAGYSGRSVQVFSAVERVPLSCQDAHHAESVHLNESTVTSSQRQIAAQDAMAARRALVDTQIGLTVGDAAEWPITVQAGTLGDVSRDVIARTDAQLLVIGQCQQRRLNAPASACASTEQLIHSPIPVYIAAPTLRGLARRVVVAMDFSETSLCAAHLAMRFSARDATLYLVHVLAHTMTPQLDARRRQLQRVAQSVRAGTDGRVESVILLGAVVPETLGFADGIQADLIACGASSLPAYPTPRPSPPSLGRVAREFIRRTPCSLLVAPELMAARR
jgi:nucleotide-binding universal stress UspA family protein